MSKLAAEISGKYSSKTSSSKTTPTSNLSERLGATLSSSQPLHKKCEKLPFIVRMSSPWLKEQSEPPSKTWYRPSGLVTGQTLGPITVAGSSSFYSSNIGPTKTVISTPHNKKPFPFPSSDKSTTTSLPPRTFPSPSCAPPPSSFPCAPMNTSAPTSQRREGGQGHSG